MSSFRFVVTSGFAATVAVSSLLVVQSLAQDKADPVERGRYLVTVGGCHDCHSPKIMTERGPEPDPERLLSGHPADLRVAPIHPDVMGPGKWFLINEHLTCAVGPWGASFAANLTSDKETGIGSWPEEMFVEALQEGKHLGSGRPILPPMPWQNLALATDQDLKAIFAYLKTTKAVKNQVPEPIAPEQLPMMEKE